MDWECTGKGKCHGCLKWCDFCGDVAAVCDADPDDELKHCDTHQCDRCFKILTRADHDHKDNEGVLRLFCSTCHAQMAIEDVEAEMIRAVELTEFWEKLNYTHNTKFWSKQAERAARKLKALQEAACAT